MTRKKVYIPRFTHFATYITITDVSMSHEKEINLNSVVQIN